MLQKRGYELGRKYGLTPEKYDEMLVAQAGKCAICGRTKGKYRLPVDHNHRTGKVRAILCHVCNKILAYLENPEWLAKATAYLEKHNAKEAKFAKLEAEESSTPSTS